MELDVTYMQVNYRVYAQTILYLPGTSEEVTFKRRPENEETMERIKGRRETRHKYSEAERQSLLFSNTIYELHEFKPFLNLKLLLIIKNKGPDFSSNL